MPHSAYCMDRSMLPCCCGGDVVVKPLTLPYWVNTESQQRYEDALSEILENGFTTMDGMAIDFRGGADELG